MGDRREILSTLFSRDAPMEHWLARVDMVRPRRPRSTVLELTRRAPNYRAVVMDGSARADQIAAGLISARRPAPVVVVADATWKSNTNLVDTTINRLGIRAIDGGQTTFCVLSTYEVDSFRRTWGPLRGRVRFVPWPYTLPESELRLPVSDNGRVFAGGDSLRDYDPLIDAAGAIPAPIDIATRVLKPSRLARLPANVWAGPLSRQVYDDSLRNASVVVVPLQPREDRSAGQTTYVNAMARGKALVVTDTPGVHDYIEDGRTGLVVPPRDPEALAAAIRRLLDDPHERMRLAERARQYALGHLSLSHYARRLLTVVDEALDGR